MTTNKKYYWLKLPTNFFDRHDMRVIQSKPDGNSILLIYLRLMTESIPHSGRLRFSEEIPYTPEMLATVIGWDKKKLIYAMDVLKKFRLLRFESDRTIFLPEVPKMIGNETGAAARMRKSREKKAAGRNEVTGALQDVAQTKSQKKEKDKEQDLKQHHKMFDDDARAKAEKLEQMVDEYRLTTVFGDYSEHTKSEYMKLKAEYTDDEIHSAVEKTLVMGGKTIAYTRKILEEARG